MSQVPRFLLLTVIASLCSPLTARLQVTGGQHAFEFLRLPQSPHLSALGGIAPAHPGPDISSALQNPALMRPGLHNQAGLAYNNYFAGMGIANLQYGYHFEKPDVSGFAGIQYLNYGTVQRTDASGAELGSFRPADMSLTVGASKAYKERWRFGTALKLAYSSLDARTAVAVLGDVGVVYHDTARGITVGAVAKAIGATLKRYNPDGAPEPLPFDLQLGFSKRFAHLPLRFSTTVHHLYRWNIRYDNPADVTSANLFGTADTTTKEKRYFADKLFRHFIFGADFLLGKRIVITGAYNHLRRGELALKDRTALTGFSFGATVQLTKLQVQYARSYYHLAGATNELGLVLQLNRLTGASGTEAKTNWRTVYDDWNL